jgi:hypothetical protein
VLNLFRFCLSQTQSISAQLKLQRIAERRSAESADFDAGGNAHLEQASAHFVVADHANDSARLADSKLGGYRRHAVFLERTRTRNESSSR